MSSSTVSQMTVTELRDLIANVVEEKLSELIGERDLEIDENVRKRLFEQKQRVDGGERGVPLADVMKDLGLS